MGTEFLGRGCSRPTVESLRIDFDYACLVSPVPMSPIFTGFKIIHLFTFFPPGSTKFTSLPFTSGSAAAVVRFEPVA
jgi:hypothetical protein